MENAHIKFFRATCMLLLAALLVTSAHQHGTYVVAANSVVDETGEAKVSEKTDSEKPPAVIGTAVDASETGGLGRDNGVPSEGSLSLRDILNKEGDTGDEYGTLAVNLEDGLSPMAGNVLMSRCPVGFTDLLLALVMLDETDGDVFIPVTASAIELSGDEETELKEGDSVRLSDMLKMMMINGSGVCRRSMAEYNSGDEETLVEKMNLYAKRLGTTNTRVSNISGDYDDRQYTNVYDIYLIMSELLKNDVFMQSFSSESADIRYLGADGEMHELFLSRPVSAVEKDIVLPEDYVFIGKLTGRDDELGSNQIVLVENEDGKQCLSILMGLDNSVDVNMASGNLIRTFNGGVFDLYHESQNVDNKYGIPVEAVVPVESNDDRYRYLFGTDAKSYTTTNKPAGYETERAASRYMRSITVPVWKMTSDGRKYSSTYTIKVHKNLVESAKAIFREIYELDIKFPIKYMVGFRYRKVGGVGLSTAPYMSVHAFGAAIDINPGDYDNDYYLGAGNDLRDKTNPYCIPDEVIKIFEKYGWFWGGNFSICADTMHFQYLGLDFLQYDSDEPFPILSRDGDNKKEVVKNLTDRLVELEYLEKGSSNFNKTVEKAVKRFQRDHELEATGVVNYETWEILINLTHYMNYVF